VDVMIDKISLGKGRDYSIKGAEQDAAMKALLQLESEKISVD
jgi:dsRNA-specific ribonuclease